MTKPSLGWIAGIGQAGSALVPFLTGALSGHFGIKVLQPLLVFLILLTRLIPDSFQFNCYDDPHDRIMDSHTKPLEET